MSELLSYRRISAGLGIAAGSLTLAACTGTIHGVSGLELLDCKNGPKTNELIIKNFAKGKSLEPGKDINTYDKGNGNGDAINGPIRIISLGDGSFEFVLRGDSDSSYSQPVGITAGHNITLTSDEQQYDISGESDGSNATKLQIDASCKIAQ